MKRILGIFCFTLLLFSCKEKQTKINYTNEELQDTSIVALTTITKDTTKILLVELPILFDSTEFLIHPIGLLSIDKRNWKDKLDNFSSRSSYSDGNDYYSNYASNYISGNFTNLVFEDIKTNEQQVLTKKFIRIYRLELLQEVYKKTGRHYLLYNLSDDDSNHDKEIDYNDIESLYMSNIDGTNFKKLTPDKQEYKDGKFIKGNLRYYFRTTEDRNHDGQFDKKDKVHYYFVDFLEESLKVHEYNPLELILK